MTEAQAKHERVNAGTLRIMAEHWQMLVMLEKCRAWFYALELMGGLSEIQQHEVNAIGREIRAVVQKVTTP